MKSPKIFVIEKYHAPGDDPDIEKPLQWVVVVGVNGEIEYRTSTRNDARRYVRELKKRTLLRRRKQELTAPEIRLVIDTIAAKFDLTVEKLDCKQQLLLLRTKNNKLLAEHIYSGVTIERLEDWLSKAELYAERVKD